MAYDLTDCLKAIDPASCNYQEWVEVGMALHAEGYPASVWDEWSQRDGARYHKGECERKFQTFRTADGNITGGTLVDIARQYGWEPPEYDMGTALSWDMTEVNPTVPDWAQPIQQRRSKQPAPAKPTLQIIDSTWVEAAEINEPKANSWEPIQELITYLETLFDANEIVGYVSESWDNEGRFVPSGKGPHDRTAGELIKGLRDGLDKGKDNDRVFDEVMGAYNRAGGAWIRFNPLDGGGVRNDNVTEFKYALVESDEMAPDKQLALMRELELPIAALVHSGNKSIHAIVRVDAPDYNEYRKRVDFLYQACRENGLKLDTQNKNPSRLSRMPGVTRGGRKQWLIATNVGQENWKAWKDWLAEQNDDLPEPESLADVWNDMPPLADPLIDGVLRQGHKMLIAGPSKAGKSFALINMCVSIAEGLTWFGKQCTQGRVLYVNLELDRASCLHRFKDVYGAWGIAPSNIGNIDIWNLRGKSKPMDQLAPSLIRRALKTRPIAVIIDPIYKVITGDENSADQMANFCNQFDKVATELGCAVIYCHHHSKGAQGGKKSMDRASGSGVFARDPDALLDMIELHVSEDLAKQQEDEAVKSACERFLDAHKADYDGWRDIIPIDDQLSPTQFLADAKKLVGIHEKELLDEVFMARKKSKAKSAWRVEGTLREFPKFEPINLWFDYPMHRIDEVGVLQDATPEGENMTMNDYRAAGREKKAKKDAANQNEKLKALREGMDACDRDGVPKTIANVIERCPEVNGKTFSKGQVQNWVKADKYDWCPIRSKGESGMPGILYDPALEEALATW